MLCIVVIILLSFGKCSLLHGDIKPDNDEANNMSHTSRSILSSMTVLFSEDRTVKLGDFCLSKTLALEGNLDSCLSRRRPPLSTYGVLS
jgi:serine/threonine protein kinase